MRMSKTKVVSKSAIETQKIAALLASELLKQKRKKAQVIALTGNLGAGKTTFTQGFAKTLGVKEKILSPTFVLLKVYKIKSGHLVHVDCYRLGSSQEIEQLGVKNIFKDARTIVLIEWAERIKKLLPPDTIWINFRHGKNQNERILYL